MSNYIRGRKKEYRVKEILEGLGYHCTRASSSKGLFDIIAVNEKKVRLIQVKYTAKDKYYEDKNCKEVRKLKVPENVTKELWVFKLGKRGYEIVELVGKEYLIHEKVKANPVQYVLAD